MLQRVSQLRIRCTPASTPILAGRAKREVEETLERIGENLDVKSQEGLEHTLSLCFHRLVVFKKIFFSLPKYQT
jgi:hypothetical protein